MMPRLSARRSPAPLLLLALLTSCSAQRKASDASTAEERSGEAEPTEQKEAPSLGYGQAENTEREGTGPTGPQVLIGSGPNGVKLSASSARVDPNHALMVAIDTPYQIFEHQGSYVHVAAWRHDGAPAHEADVFVGSAHVGKTDPHGSLVFRYPPKGGSALRGDVITVVDAQERDRRGSVPFQPNLRTESFASDHLFVYTDRGVYRPGDSVNIRLIGWHLAEDYSPLREQDVELVLRDAQGGVVGGARRTTDELGVASMSLPLPRTAAEGLYELEVSYKQERQRARLQVREFKQPSVQIAHDLPRYYVIGQKSLAANVTLSPAQGGTFGAGTLRLRAAHGGAQIAEISRRIKGNGPHEIAFSSADLRAIEAQLQEGEWLTLTLHLEDEAKRQEEVVRELRFTQNPYVAVIELDKDTYSTGDLVELVAKVRDLDGVPLREKAVALRFDGKRFEGKTDGSGIAHFTLEMPEHAAQVELYLPPITRPVLTQPIAWTAPRAMVSHIADPVIKERAQAHVTVRFPAEIRPVEQVVHMDVVDTSGALVNAVQLPVEETPEGFVARGSFTAPTWGSMLLTFFSLGEQRGITRDPRSPQRQIGLMTEGQNLVVTPDRELEIVLDGVPDQVAPGSHLDIDARVLTHDGMITIASLGAAVVDRRVISLKDPMEITPMDHFYEPTLRTMSTTGSKILSWPVVSRNWGSHQIDVALPPFPFLEGGAINATQDGPSADAFTPGSPPTEPMPEPEANEDAPSPPKKKSVLPSPSDAKDKKVYELAEQTIEGKLAKPDGDAMQARATTPRREQERAEPKQVQITIRTRFPETSFWNAHLRVNGSRRLSLDIPDTITDQELILVASNARGAVGLKRQVLRVTQDLFAQADLPKKLYQGERVMVPVSVTNGATSPQRVTLSLSAESGLEVGDAPHTLTLAPQQSAVVMFPLEGKEAGSASYELVAQSEAHRDVVRGEVRIWAAGVSQTRRQELRFDARQREVSFEVPAGATDAEAVLTLSPPTLTTALGALAGLDRVVRDEPLTLATDLASAALVLRHAEKRGLSSAQVDDLRNRIISAVSHLQSIQAADGSFSYWRTSQSSPYITCWVLEGLLEALELDIPISREVIQRAVTSIIAAHKRDALIDASEIAFWEGDQRRVREGLSAEIFDVLTRVPSAMAPDSLAPFLNEQAPLMQKLVTRTPADPLAIGHAVQGLARMKRLDPEAAKRAIDALERARDQSHWEPSWFHAYAGRVEATAAMIEAMAAVDPRGYALKIHDALSWILSTREAWGTWHNERGTASALRALLAIAPAPGLDGTLVVSLDGREVSRMKLDPADPFPAAVALSHLTLGTGITPGRHTLTVQLDGSAPDTMRLPGNLQVQSWQSAALTTSQDHDGTRLKVSAPEVMQAGASATLEIALASASAGAGRRLRIGASALVEPDLQRLSETLHKIDEQVVAWHREEDELVLELAPTLTSATLKLPLEAVRRGVGRWPVISLEESNGREASAALRVSAGTLTVR